MFVPKFSDISFMLIIKAFGEPGDVPWLRYYKVWEGEVYLTPPLKLCKGLSPNYPSNLALLPPSFSLCCSALATSNCPCIPTPYSSAVSPHSRLFSFCFVVYLPSAISTLCSAVFLLLLLFHPLYLAMSLPPTLFLLSLPVYISELNPSLVVTKPLKSCIANVLNPHAYPTFFFQLRLVIPLRRVCLNSPLSVII